MSQHIARVNYDCEQNEIVPESRYMVDEPSTIRIRWHCRSDDRELAEMLPKETQEQIEQLTGTKLVEDLNGQIIDITSPTEEAGERALRKLEILRRSYVSAQDRMLVALLRSSEPAPGELCHACLLYRR